MKKHTIQTIIILLAVVIMDTIASMQFLSMHTPETLYPGDKLTKIKKLSDYSKNLKGGTGDTEIYVFDSGQEGASVLLLGGTHPNEPSSYITATVILENVIPEQGKLFIIPRACASGFTCTDPFEGYPEYYTIETQSGERQFRFGSRVSNPLDQWPDPLVYTHHPSGQQLSGFETRNLNRAYPGREDGTFTEQVAFGIVELIKKESIDVAFDLHEAAPEIPIINAIVYHENSEELALSAVLNLEFLDLSYAPELSPKNFHGLSHREWGDNTNVLPILMETCNPIQGRLRGKTNEELIRYGKSDQYAEAQKTGALRIVYNAESGEPLEKRVGRHIQGFKEVLNVYNEYNPENNIILNNLPDYEDIIENTLKAYLK